MNVVVKITEYVDLMMLYGRIHREGRGRKDETGGSPIPENCSGIQKLKKIITMWRKWNHGRLVLSDKT